MTPLAAPDEQGAAPAGEHPDALGTEDRAVTARLLRRIARDERLSGARALAGAELSDDPRTRLALVSVARDELRHQLTAELLLERLDALQATGRTVEEHVPASLAPPADDADPEQSLDMVWVSLALADRAAAVRLDALAACRWQPLARAARAMARDEREHAALGTWHLRRAARDPESRDRIRDAVAAVLGPTLDAFGIDDPPDRAAREDAGLHVASASQLRERYLREVRRLLEETSIAHPRWSPPWQGRTGAVAAASAEPHLVVGG